MKMDRELIYSRLFDLLREVSGVKTFSRRLKVWTDVSAADMPAVFLQQLDEVSETTKGLKTKWTFLLDIYVYVNVGSDPKISPYTILNPILDDIINLFDQENNEITGGVNTLGGLVHSVKINGKLETDGGAFGPIAIAMIPIEIIVAR